MNRGGGSLRFGAHTPTIKKIVEWGGGGQTGIPVYQMLKGDSRIK